MANDDKDRADQRQGERDEDLFGRAERDAGDAARRIDRDDDQRFPDSEPDSGNEPPDPGYSAFAEALDDPLAEWPAPDAVLEELPEMRARKAPTPAADEDVVDDFLNDLDDADSGDSDYSGSDYGDSDSNYGDSNYSDSDYGENRGAPGAATPAGDCAFIDTMRDARANLAREMSESEGARAVLANADTPSAPAPAKADEERPSGPHLGTIALLALALVALGAGAYGVIQQRGAMQAEIRELQAQLASTLSADEAAAEHQRRRQIELENETLRSEREALQVENAALGERVSRLQAQLARQQASNEKAAAAQKAAAQRQAAAREAERQLARRQREESAESQAAANASAPAGPWFVNFGSYAQRQVADRWASRLTVAEGRVVVKTASAAGKTVYRVRVVDLATRDAAERVAVTLERQYALPRLWVGRART